MNSHPRSICAAILLAVLATPAAAQTAPPPPAPAAAAPQVQGTVAAVHGDYVIGPDDVLGIVFWREPDISGDVTVRPDGRITIPVIGAMTAAGLRPEELQREVTAAARKFITDVNVAVVVRTINSRKVYVTGRVTTPGPQNLTGPLTVVQAIALAGGLTEYADGKNITVLRNEEGGPRSYKVNYRDILKGKNLTQNIPLRPGDTIVVP